MDEVRGKDHPAVLALRVLSGNKESAGSHKDVGRYPLLNYNIEVEVERNGERHIERAVVDSRMFFFAPTADVIEGDVFLRKLPNGHVQRYVATEVTLLESPFSGGSNLNHIEAKVKLENPIKTNPAPTANYYSATNMQVTAGDSFGTTMNVGMGSEETAALLSGIVTALEKTSSPLPAEAKALAKSASQAIETQDEEQAKGLMKYLKPALEKACDKASDEGMKALISAGIKLLFAHFGISS